MLAIREINKLYQEIEAAGKVMIDKAIRIGELLSEQKSSMKQGEWIPWVEANLPFKKRQASSYMRAFIHRKTLKGQSTAHLEGAIASLMQSKEITKNEDTNDRDAEDQLDKDAGRL